MEDRNEEIGKLGREIIGVLDDILSSGDWDSSLFLKTSGSKLKSLRDRAKEICEIDVAKDKKLEDSSGKGREVESGYSRVHVLLYQVDGINLQGWFRTIRSLSGYTVNRPAYKEESEVLEFIRSKNTNIECHGYLTVDIKDSDLYQTPDQVDSFGHQFFGLKEEAIKIENVIEFVHANKKRYAVGEKELELLGEI